ncbi:MAG: hypothetical protein K9N07_00505 [Candidatus Cloacimonetes bacterium]|nr:hypothetical protein [Candidatus Cloacimonadota bacterium]
MNLNKFLLLSAVLIIISNCAVLTIPETEKERLLSENLTFWNNIRIDGIIAANYGNFVFRKNVTIKKNNSVLRLDIYDSGIFGLNPTPFISAYYDSVLSLRMLEQDTQEFERISKNELNLSILFKLSDLLVFRKEIINDQQVQSSEFKIKFSKNMEIIEISDNKEQFKIKFHYNRTLESITLYKENRELGNIQIDKITHPIDSINRF